MEETKKDKRTRIAIFYDNTYKEISRLTYTKIQLFWLAVFIFIVLFILDFFIISYSPVRYFIKDYPTPELVNTMKINSIMLDSIQEELAVKNQYINNLLAILRGDVTGMVDSSKVDSIGFLQGKDSNNNFPQIKNVISPEDSMLRQEVEEQEMFATQMGKGALMPKTNLYQLNFFPPVKGVVSNEYNPSRNHFGVDIVASPGQMVLSVLDGTVINAGWTVKTGYTVQIQHPGNIITAYKHLNNVLLDEGQRVKAGQPIATVGNTGELSTGPHLHFELWYNGQSLNPEEYISFK